MSPDVRLLVLAKAPVPGRSKTRLTPAFSPQEAADLAEAALRDTLEAVDRAIAAARRAGVHAEPVLVLDGKRPGWLPVSHPVLPQVAGGLDVRLAGAFAAGCVPPPAASASAARVVPCLLIGMDTPQVPADLLAATLLDLADPASGADAHLGPATDGGWWALGLRRPEPGLLLGLPMSTAGTCTATRRRLRDAGLRVRDLPALTDVDTPQDAASVAAQAPWSLFAEAYRRLRAVAS